jgi:photosystem II stability/assembly factor-like uncharacterized protein
VRRMELALVLGIFAVVFLPPSFPPKVGGDEGGGNVPIDMMATTAGRVYASPDCAYGGWGHGGGTDELIIYSLASHSGSPKVYAGLWGDGVYITPSGTNSWSPTSLMAPIEVASLAIDPASPASVVYAGTRGNGIQRSDSGGASWITAGLEGKDVWSLAIASGNPIYAYAGTAGEIYTSADGTNWDLAGSAQIGTDRFYTLAVDPQDSRIAYVGTKVKGVYRTTDGGTTWTPRGLYPMTVRTMALHPDDRNIIYAGTQSSGIFKTTDGGASWPVNGLVGRDVLAIAINPRNPEFVYAGTHGDGVWASDDGGHSWYKLDGLTGGAALIYSLTLFTPEEQSGCQRLYAGTTSGVWARGVTSLYTFYLPLVHK